jgi:uncharacterized protein
MRMPLRWAATGLVLAAAGCASDPVHFHTLVPPAASLASERISPEVMLDMRPVHVPGTVDRSELVVRQGKGGTALLERELWMSPLQDELYSALSLELARQLATSHQTGRQGRRRIKVRVNVQRFEGELGHYALIEAEWRLSTSSQGSAPELACRSLHVQSAPGGVPQLVEGYRRSTTALADDIAAAADRLLATADTDCGS